MSASSKKRYRLRVIAPAYPAFNIYSRIASTTTALGPVCVAIAANKIRGIYASVCHDCYSAAQAVEHDDMNVLCLGARIVGVELAKRLVDAFLSAEYLDSGNYARRVGKVHDLERNFEID